MAKEQIYCGKSAVGQEKTLNNIYMDTKGVT